MNSLINSASNPDQDPEFFSRIRIQVLKTWGFLDFLILFFSSFSLSWKEKSIFIFLVDSKFKTKSSRYKSIFLNVVGSRLVRRKGRIFCRFIYWRIPNRASEINADPFGSETLFPSKKKTTLGLLLSRSRFHCLSFSAVNTGSQMVYI